MRVPVKVTEIIAALEREADNTNTDPRWHAACELRRMAGYEARTLMCEVDTDPTIEISTTGRASIGGHSTRLTIADVKPHESNVY